MKQRWGSPMATDSPSLYGKNLPDDDGSIGDIEPRCKGCGKLLAMLVTRPWRIRCVRCKVENIQPAVPDVDDTE